MRKMWARVLALTLAAVLGAACSSSGTSVPTSTQVQITSTAAPLPTAIPSSDPELDTELSTPADGAAISPPGASAAGGLLPDPVLTPGDVFPVGVGDICVAGYSSRVRNVSTSTKNAVYAEYHVVSHTTGQYEVDHLIPLELGGSNDIKNLWPEPANPTPGFHQKDALENRLHGLVCAGSVDLAIAQQAIASDWYTAYVQYVLGGVAPPPAPVFPVVPPPSSDTNTPPVPPSASDVTFISVIGARPGGVASATVLTSAGATCSISYVTPAGTKSTAQGLTTTTAGADGTASWVWNIGPSTRPGIGTVTVSCGGASASAPITIG